MKNQFYIIKVIIMYVYIIFINWFVINLLNFNKMVNIKSTEEAESPKNEENPIQNED